jgi:hypothetical protein
MKHLFALTLLLCIGMPIVAQSTLPNFTHLMITMKVEGGPCFSLCLPNEYRSCCPGYSVSLDENGTVIYDGVIGVKERGERVHSIPIPVVRDLVGEFLRIKFYSLQDRYIEKKLPNGMTETIDHANATTISIDIDGKKKSVYIFYGAPDELIRLREKVDEVMQIAQYTGRT